MITLKLIEGVDVEVDARDIKSAYRGPDQFTGEPPTKIKTTWVDAIDRSQPTNPTILLITTNPLDQLLTELLSYTTPCPRVNA